MFKKVFLAALALIGSVSLANAQEVFHKGTTTSNWLISRRMITTLGMQLWVNTSGKDMKTSSFCSLLKTQ